MQELRIPLNFYKKKTQTKFEDPSTSMYYVQSESHWEKISKQANGSEVVCMLIES